MKTALPEITPVVPKTKKRRRLQWAKHQKEWFGKWHLYLGIFAGLIVSVVGVTGSILVFSDEIDEALNPAYFQVLAQQRKIPVEEIIPMIREKYPDLKFDYFFNERDELTATYRLYNFTTEEEFFINPYTAALSAKRIYESSFIHIVTDIHRTLLIPVVGRYIVGISTLVLLILTITGLRLWIPQKWKQLKSVLTVNFRASFKRQNYDWHNVLGFYSAPVVVVLSLTGICFTFSPLVIALIFILNGQSPQGVAAILGAQSSYKEGITPLPLKDIINIGKNVMPDGKIAGIGFPADSVGSYRLDIIGTGLPKDGKREMLILDQYTGKVLLNNRTDFPDVGNAYLSWLPPLHYGSFGGLPTQILALTGGLIPLILFITGFIIWWPRFQKQQRKARKQKEFVSLSSANGQATAPVVSNSFPLPIWQYFWQHCKKGAVYASWFVLIAGIMGALYGVSSGIVIEPALFTILFTAIFVVSNFIVALIALLFNVLFLAPFKKGSRPLVKYIALSSSFAIVFLAAYFILTATGLKIF